METITILSQQVKVASGSGVRRQRCTWGRKREVYGVFGIRWGKVSSRARMEGGKRGRMMWGKKAEVYLG